VGAAVTLLIAAVPSAVARVVVGSQVEGGERNLWVVPVLALFVAFAVGGHTAAKSRPTSPYRQAAASAVVAFGAFLSFTLVRRLLSGDGLSFPLLVTLALLFQITVSLALLGGYVAWRQHRSNSLTP
jgi:predicted permease